MRGYPGGGVGPMNPGQIVVIEWLDIYSDSGWLDKDEIAEFAPAKARSVGIVLSCDEKVLKLAHNMCVEDGTSDVTAYPVGVITDVKVLSDG